MNLSEDDIKEGGFYVNSKKGLVREIWQISPMTGNAHWRSYYLKSGDPTGDSLCCSKLNVRRWADRIATDEEVARMKSEYAKMMDLASTEDFVIQTLQHAPAHLLLDEVRRRGLDLSE